ncbi:TetR/AcrR family transcriptional regulator [Agromyces binzhouensis]|uniref:TetR family transcriptional regulator n=1 Tax=Agromyces binzhouensis TaxID=1817495 RepID=A0A4V1QSF5_9MICO|nr:TetR family transcriptional regulator C-terminal domain-containing protein [Agromyces binzhouensis]RXZ48213.1 TetR family transcriptional regulator [Agromyces binzhouensis]
MSTPVRTRAARKSPAERSAEIVEAARLVALEQGLTAVTLRAIAARAGVAPALVAHYQPSMDALVADTFAHIVAEELDELSGLLAALPGPTERLGTLLDTLLDGTRDDVTIVWVEAWALGRRNDALAASVRTQMDDWQALLRRIIEEGVDRAGFRAPDVDAAAWQILGMVDGLNAQALVRWGDASERGSLIHGAVEGMLGLQHGALAVPD